MRHELVAEMETYAIREVPVKAKANCEVLVVDRGLCIHIRVHFVIVVCSTGRLSDILERSNHVSLVRPEGFKAEDTHHVEGRSHGDGRFKLAEEARHEHAGLLFGDGNRSKGSRNTRKGNEASHHDVAVGTEPVTDIVTTHEGEVSRPLGMHRNLLFNNLLAGKLIVGIDESCLGENKEVGETLKYLSTSNTVHVELKGKDKTEKPAFFKFVLASNELRKAVFVGKDEVRFWVMRLTPWADENVDLSFDKMIEEEVPAFLWYLQKRYNEGKMYVPAWEDRMWFKAKRLINKDLETMMDGTSSNVEGSLRSYMHDLFLDTNRLKLEFDLKYILYHIDGAKRRGENYMRIMLEDMEGVYRDGGQRKVAMPEYVTEEDLVRDSNLELGSIKWPTKKTTCRPYTFDAKYFLNPSEYQTIAESKKPPVTPKQQTMDFDQQPSAPADANQPATTDGAKAEGEEPVDPL